MSAFKRARISGSSALNTNYISSENSTSTAASSFTGQFVYAVQYGSIKVSVASDKNGVLTLNYSDDGVTVRETVTDTTTGGSSYFRVFPIENQYVQVIWTSSAGLPTSLVIYSLMQKLDSSGLTPVIPVVGITAGNAGIGVGGAYPNFSISNLMTLTAGTNISITGSFPNFTISGTMSVASSYITITQSPSASAANAALTAVSTTVVKTSDWTNNGTGRYTYTGATPQRFAAELDCNFTFSASSASNEVSLVKNGLFNSTANAFITILRAEPSGSSTTVTGMAVSSGFTMQSGDYLELFNCATANTVTGTVQFSVVNTFD